MVDEQLLERLERLAATPFAGEVYRHTTANYPPEAENTWGARWNPQGVAAIYTSLDRDTAIAEGEHILASQPVRPKVKRSVHRIRVGLERVIDLRDPELLAELGVDARALQSSDHWDCQRVGEAAARLCEGIFVPSARGDGGNLVVYPPNPRGFVFDVIESVVIDPGPR
jgi:RES domain-containing protein